MVGIFELKDNLKIRFIDCQVEKFRYWIEILLVAEYCI